MTWAAQPPTTGGAGASTTWDTGTTTWDSGTTEWDLSGAGWTEQIASTGTWTPQAAS